MKYKQLNDFDGIELELPTIHKFACCDCGLIHKFAFAIEENGNLGIAFAKDNRATSQHRRKIMYNKDRGNIPK